MQFTPKKTYDSASFEPFALKFVICIVGYYCSELFDTYFLSRFAPNLVHKNRLAHAYTV